VIVFIDPQVMSNSIESLDYHAFHCTNSG